MRPSYTTQVHMTDRTVDSTMSAHDEKSVSQQQDEAFEQMEKDLASCNKPNHTPHAVNLHECYSSGT